MARSTTKFPIVHCPRSHRYFGHSPFQLEKLRELGFNICLGTDSLASNDDLSLFAEMRELHRNHPTFAPEEILEMVTINPGRALDRQSQLGQNSVAAFGRPDRDADRGERDVFEQIISLRSNGAMGDDERSRHSRAEC